MTGREMELSQKSEKMNSLVKEQVDMIKQSQEKLHNLVENINDSENEIDLSTVESVKDIVKKSETLIVLVQVIVKVRNELGHARLDLEKAKKAKKMVKEAKNRLEWLEKRLEKLLVECHEKANHLLKSATVSSLGESLAQTHLSGNKDERFTPSQCERLFSDVGGYCVKTPEVCHSEKRNCYNVTKNVLDMSQRLIEQDDKNYFNEEESSTSFGNVSYPDRNETKHSVADDKNSCTTVSSLKDFNDKPRTTIVTTRDSQTSLGEDYDDDVEKYWKSDHHRFDWPDSNVQTRSPNSWHSLGLPVQDSFIAKERPVFTPDLPWKEKATQVNSVLDIHKIALDKLYARLHHMYEVIEKATEASIKPVLKNDKIEARMRNIESATRIQREISKDMIPEDSAHKKSDDSEEKLPKLDQDNVPVRQIDAKRKSSVKMPRLVFPRNSNVWCASKASAGGRVVKKIKTKPPTQQSKTQAILARKMLENNEANTDEMKKQEAMIWRPSIVYKMVKATKVLKIFQAQLQQYDATRKCDQKWNRVEWLLGPNGLLSPTKKTVIDSLKALSELRCSEEEVGAAIKTFLRESKDPRILYEASKALILSGHWHSSAIEILQNALKFGSKSLKQEILDVLCSVDNIPFFDKKAQPFQETLDVLEDLIQGNDPSLAFSSALCLGRLFVVHPVAKRYLLDVIKTNSLISTQRCQALNVLVRQMNSKDKIVVESLLHELSTSVSWKVRVQACDLLMFVGNRHVLAKDVDEIFQILERLLWDHAHQVVRSKVAELLNTLRLRNKACSLVHRRLDDPEDTVRARAIISMATLEMKGEKELKSLLDILALDSSVYARIQAVRAFSKLKWDDPRVLRSLRERERGEGILAREAKKALEQLTGKGK
ncbi:uncharacterized protein LOC114519362 [Dendronephthya gigantea]|uniref:uncharacterized protein LOC114519362 n=1 Tax=Dendronephthya gigantea TaxID=151771 RepID=UPI00106C6D99|nr:uncharacterized protein LOC114519362 [Dendronephthya gigantea]